MAKLNLILACFWKPKGTQEWSQNGTKIAPKFGLGPSWGHLGAILGPRGAILGLLGAVLEAILGPIWGQSWNPLGPYGGRRPLESATNRGEANWQKSGANAWEVRKKWLRWNEEAQKGEAKSSDFAWEVPQKLENEGVEGRGLRRQIGRFV